MGNCSPFHLAIPVDDLAACESFYTEVLGCSRGRSSDHWVDLNLFGHQLVIHLDDQAKENPSHNAVDGKSVPIPHFGVVLPWEAFEAFEKRLIEHQISFIIEPYVRFAGQVGEQKTMFFKDPAGNALEFKSFKQMNQLFASS